MKSACDTPRLLFIGGFPSGGTDLVKNIINAHPDAFIQGESPLLHRLSGTPYHSEMMIRTEQELEAFRTTIRKLDVWTNLSVSKGSFSDWLDRLPMTVEQLLFFTAKPASVVGNKTPQNTEYILDLHRLFPQARFLIVLRDVRDVALSWSKKWGKDPYHCAAKWSERMGRFMDDRRLLPDGLVHLIKFEALLDDPLARCEDICEFLGLEWSDNMVAHHQFTREKLDGKLNYGEPLKRDNKQKWNAELSSSQIRTIEEIAFDTMQLVGYHPQIATRHRSLRPIRRVVGYGRDALAIAFVGNRKAADNGVAKRLRSLSFQVKRKLLTSRIG